MSSIVLLDTATLGAMSHPEPEGANAECYDWFKRLLARNRRVIVPEICDYELRRELIRAHKTRGIRRLDEIIAAAEYLPIHTEAIRKAAQLWAEARNRGTPTADPQALDGDVILAGQALTLNELDVVIATTNIDHLIQFVPAADWRAIEQ